MARKIFKIDNGTGAGPLRVLFAGGGTGGHVIPGAATAEALRQMLPSSRCLFLVSDRKVEMRCTAALADFETALVPATRWEGVLDKVRFPVQSARAAERMLLILRGFRPHVVVGLGGYNCVVPVLLARILGIRTLIVEANALPGRAVRMLAPIADCVAVQWKQAAGGMRARRVLEAGSPVRARLFRTSREIARRRLGLSPDKCTLLALGGSQGALALNRALFGAVRLLQDRGQQLQVLHLTGVDHLHLALEARQRLNLSYRPIGFLDRIEEAYAAADFALARAGGSTLAYLTAAGLPAILVPYPHAADNHQEANARVLAEAGAALMLMQSDMNQRRLADLIGRLTRRADLRAQMSERARALGRPEAAQTVAAEVAAMAGFGRRMRHLPERTEEVLRKPSQAA